ncbi:MAG: hypothetical protein RMA76_39555 [Deltaproteobacteria bacterium]
MRRWLLAVLLLPACVDPPAQTGSGLAPAGAVTVEVTEAIPETERGPQHDLVIDDHVAFEDVRAADARWVVDHDGVLWRVTDGTKRRVLDHVLGLPVEHPAGPIVVREGQAPGDATLWLLAAEPRALTTGPGDSMPFVLPDARVVFVSTRTTVASVWILDAQLEEARQLTNVGLVAGRGLDGFVPTPAERFVYKDGLTYDAGGVHYHLDPDTGAARRLP